MRSPFIGFGGGKRVRHIGIGVVIVFLVGTAGCASSAKAGADQAHSSDSTLGTYLNCSFGDADACKQVDSMEAHPGGAEGQVEHDAMVQEQLKSPEQRAMDSQRRRGPARSDRPRGKRTRYPLSLRSVSDA